MTCKIWSWKSCSLQMQRLETIYLYPRVTYYELGIHTMRDRIFSEDGNDATFQPGKRLDIPGRARKRTNQITDEGRSIRTQIDERLKDSEVNPANENITTSTFVGAVGTAIVWLLEDYLPGRIGADAEIVGADPSGEGVTYTIDTNAMIESQARFRSVIDAGTGITSLWTDEIEVESIELVKSRPARDTFRYEITVID